MILHSLRNIQLSPVHIWTHGIMKIINSLRIHGQGQIGALPPRRITTCKRHLMLLLQQRHILMETAMMYTQNGRLI